MGGKGIKKLGENLMLITPMLMGYRNKTIGSDFSARAYW